MPETGRLTIDFLCRSGIVELQTGPFGSQLHAHDYVNNGVPVVPTEAIQDRRIDHENLPQISPEKAAELFRHRLRKDDIIFARRGVQATGQSAFVRSSEEGFICGTGAIRLRVKPNNKLVRSNFLSHLLMDRTSRDWIRHNAIGATMPNLNEGIIRRFSFTAPPIEDQSRIAELLDALDDKIELNRRMNETLEAMARAIFKDWFVDFGPTRAKMAMRGEDPQKENVARASYLAPDIWSLFPDRLDDGGKPEGWGASNVGREFFLTMGQSPPGETYNDTEHGLPFFQGRTDFGFRYPENRKYCSAPTRIAKPDDTLVSVRAPVGDINMSMQECCIGRGISSVRHKSGSRSYTYYSMISIQPQLKAFEHTGTVFGSINKVQFEALPITRPSSKLVDKFEALAFPLDERIKSNLHESRTLAATRDLLLPKLMSGEIRVRDAEKIVGSAS